MSSNRNSVVQMANYQAPQRSGDIVMIQSEHTGAIDILSADLESADLLGDHRKGKTFGSMGGGFCFQWVLKERQAEVEGKTASDL